MLDSFTYTLTHILDLLVTVHIHRLVELPPRSSSVKRNDGSYTAICNTNDHFAHQYSINKEGNLAKRVHAGLRCLPWSSLFVR